jgi:hypothetical protein
VAEMQLRKKRKHRVTEVLESGGIDVENQRKVKSKEMGKKGFWNHHDFCGKCGQLKRKGNN